MRNSILLVVCVVVASGLAFIGLGGESTPVATQPVATEPGAAAQVRAGQPGPGEAKSTVEGEVLEAIDVAGYTYLRLGTAGGEIWAAVPRSTVTKGSQARIVDASLMQQFRSDTLDRTFDRIYFGVLAGGDGAPSGHGGVTPPASSGSASGSGLEVGKVAPLDAEDARSVAQLFSQKADLAGKSIRVRGKVVKVTRGVLGKTWLHIQDGSGSAETKDNDLVVTTAGDAQIGDIVIVKGLVVVDKDLGAGYRYAVLLEDAEVTVEAAE